MRSAADITSRSRGKTEKRKKTGVVRVQAFSRTTILRLLSSKLLTLASPSPNPLDNPTFSF
jgi:hypothetical protein